jgi:hypothetical protein
MLAEWSSVSCLGDMSNACKIYVRRRNRDLFEHVGSRRHMIQKDLKIDNYVRVHNEYLNRKEFYIVSAGEQLLKLQRSLLPWPSSSNSLKTWAVDATDNDSALFRTSVALYRVRQKYLTILQNSCVWNRWRG